LISWFIFVSVLLIIFLSTTLRPYTIIGRLASFIAVLFGVTIIVSGSLRLVPGDPIDHILGDQAQSTSRELLAKDLGLLDRQGNPIGFVKQYSNFLISLLKLDIKSFTSRRNALVIIGERLPYTLILAVSAMLIAIIIGPSLGVIAAFFKNRWPDHLLILFALMGISIPSFFLGPLLLLIFSIQLRFFPVGGADDGLLSITLPSLSLGLALAAMLARMSRASILEILSEDFIRTAYAKGLSSAVVFFKHALRNALIPVITLIGLQFGAVLSGTVVTEKIFNWPGIGLLLLESIQRLDLPMVQVCVLVIAIIYAVINLLTDIIYGCINPRILIGSLKK
jgi:peptide/nickel transport system permease protein